MPVTLSAIEDIEALMETKEPTTEPLFDIEVLWQGEGNSWSVEGVTNQRGISEYRRQEWQEKPSVEIGTIRGTLFLNRADFKAVRFTAQE